MDIPNKNDNVIENNTIFADPDKQNNTDLVKPIKEVHLSKRQKYLQSLTKFLRNNWKKLIYFVLLCFVTGISTCTVSIYFPFYPTFAEDVKSLNSSFVGIVIGMISLLVFFFSLLFGVFIKVFGVKFLFLSGLIILTGTYALMYFHPFMPAAPFAIYSVIFAITQSYGIASSIIASYSIGMNLFPQYKNTVISWIDFSTGIGYMVGPALGGELYTRFGYSNTYLVTAILSGIGLITLIFLLPFCKLHSIEEENYRDYLNMFKFLTSGNVVVIVINNVFVSMSWSILYSTYGSFLETTYCISSAIVGYAFALANLSYTFSLPLIGYLTDKISSVRVFIFIGLLLEALGLLFTPPLEIIFENRPDIFYRNLTCETYDSAPAYNYSTSTMFLVISFIGQFLLGIGFVLAYNPSFPDLKKHTKRFNLPNMDEKLSALRLASYYLGDGTGPIISGVLINFITFDQMLMIFIGILLSLIILIGFSTLINYIMRRRSIRQSIIAQS